MIEKLLKVKARSVGLHVLNVINGSYSDPVILSVFDKTINIRFGDELVVVTSTSLRAPINLNINVNEGFNSLVDVYDEVHIGSGHIAIGSLYIDVSRDTPVYVESLGAALGNPPVDIKSVYAYSIRLAILARLLGDVKEDSAYTNEIIRNMMSSVISKLIEHIRINKSLEQSILSRIIGVGHGYTPSGDDIALGLIAAWNLMEPLGLQPIIPGEELLEKTHWVSGRLLLYASKGLLAEPLDLGMYRLVAYGDVEGALDAVLDMARYGHSSGTEIMGGLALGLALALEHLDYRGVASRVAGILFD